MAPLGKKSDRQWRFVGQEVTGVEGLTSEHIRLVYGLGPRAHDSHEEAKKVQEEATNSDKKNNIIFPFCENRYTGAATESSSLSKGNLITCAPGRCKEGNPHCLNHMGQDQWEGEDAFDKYFSIFGGKPDPGLSKRPENTPAGMKNLGATCYANSLLQVWFHDLALRDAIYRCRFNEDTDSATSALFQLQLLFAHLDRGTKKFYNPLSLVASLKLDTSMQQDAQEFCSLFMAMIGSHLQKQKDDELGGFIKNQFQGQYSYHTTCENCKNTSVRSCTFNELMLNIQDNCTLMDCLEEFVEPENLAGDDRYFCSACSSLQNASRRIKLDKLPNVLNIQLMRFVFDSKTSSKKKSKDMIRFPEIMDLTDLLGSKETVQYHLTAVLVHRGPSAHSGHFMAHVLNRENDNWFVLNDENVEEFHGTHFDPEDHSHTASSSKKVTTSGMNSVSKLVSHLSSRNAYMLTYTCRKNEISVKPSAPPAEILRPVLQDNAGFERELQEYEEYKQRVKGDFERARHERRELYQCWNVSKDEDKGCYVDAEALLDYVRLDSGTPETLDNSNIACEHGKLCPVAVTKSKRISEVCALTFVNPLYTLTNPRPDDSIQSAKQLLEVHRGIKIKPLLTTEDLCDICTRNTFQDKLYAIMHRRDIEEFERKLKGKSHPTKWLSKAWLADWTKVSPRLHPLHGTTSDDPNPISEAFMSDVLCPHSALCPEKTRRRLINKASLDVLSRVFGAMPLPDSDTVECPVCREQLQPHKDNMKELAEKASLEKSELMELNMRGGRIGHMQPGRVYYAVSVEGFIKKWQDFIKKPAVNERPEIIENTSLLCKHDQFTFDLNNIVDIENEDDFYVLRQEEWEYLQAIYGGGPTIVITMTEEMQEDDDPCIAHTTMNSTPSVCLECRNERILDYMSTTLVIRVYSPGEAANGDADSPVALHSTSELPGSTARNMKTYGAKGKRKHAPTNSTLEVGSRRSKRTKAVKKPYKEIKIIVNKSDTVMDLKLKIMQKTDIVPLYQKLVHDKIEMDKNENTMADLEIPPNAVLDLIAFDQSMDSLDLNTLQDVASTPGDEGGFGGTGLAEDWF